MSRIKTSVFTIIATAACLMLLLAPGFYRDEASSSGKQAAIWKSTAINEPGKTLPIEHVQAGPAIAKDALSISRRNPENLSDSPEFAQSTDWTRMMYPDLYRIEKLERHSAHTALDELLPMLASDDPTVRLAAIESIGDMTMPNVLPILSMALDDPDPLVRVTALEALASQDNEAAAGSIELYLYDDDRNVRAAAIDALAELEAESAVPALASLLSDRDSSIRRKAVYALGDIGGKTAMMYLLQARYDANAAIRIDAEAIIAELKYDAAY